MNVKKNLKNQWLLVSYFRKCHQHQCSPTFGEQSTKSTIYLDQKHSSGRRAYEDWVRRKKLEEAEKRRWGSIEEIDYSYDRRPFC